MGETRDNSMHGTGTTDRQILAAFTPPDSRPGKRLAFPAPRQPCRWRCGAGHRRGVGVEARGVYSPADLGIWKDEDIPESCALTKPAIRPRAGPDPRISLAAGGSFEHRVRFSMEVTEAVWRVWPDSLPLFVRTSASDWIEHGWRIDESVQLAASLKIRVSERIRGEQRPEPPKTWQ